MLCACEDVEVGDEAVTEAILRKHTAYNLGKELSGILLELLFRSRETLATGITRVADIHAIGHFLTGQLNLVCVDDDYIVTAVLIGGKTGFVLAAKDLSYLRAHAAEDLTLSVDYNPTLLSVSSFFAYRNGFLA